MRDYVIITDSCCDLTEELSRKAQLTVIPMVLTLANKEYRNYLDGREISVKDFYARLPFTVTPIDVNLIERYFLFL